MTVEEALGTTKSIEESWKDVFARINKTRGIDIKTLVNVIISILEELDVQKQRTAYDTGTDTNTHTYTGENRTSGTISGTENKPLSEGAIPTEGEVPSGV